MYTDKKMYGYDDIILAPISGGYATINTLPRNQILSDIMRSDSSKIGHNLISQRSNTNGNSFRLVNAPMTVFRPEGIQTLIDNHHIPFVFLPRLDYWNLREYYDDNKWSSPEFRLSVLEDILSSNSSDVNLSRIVPSISLKDIDPDNTNTDLIDLLAKYGVSVLLDVAWPGTERHRKYLTKASKHNLRFFSGNVSNTKLANEMFSFHNNLIGVRIGIGSGAGCSTKLNTASGSGSINAFLDGYKSQKDRFYIADGGIRHSGDYIKALAIGADLVMSGKMIAQCSDVATFDSYIGLASQRNRQEATVESSNKSIEGVSFSLNKKDHNLNDLISQINENLVTAMIMQGISNINEFQRKAKDSIRFVSNSTLNESYPNPS
jgi:hypothetical protein